MRLGSLAGTATVVLLGTLLAAAPSPATGAQRGGGEDGGPCAHPERATHTGTDGDDVIRGTFGRDVIFAGAGDDEIHGKGTEDTICAGPGDDVVYGGSGRDRISTGGGRDLVVGGAGNDQVWFYGGAGDTVHGGDDVDVLTLQLSGDGAGLGTMEVRGSKPGLADENLDALVVVARHTERNLPIAVDARTGEVRTDAPGTGVARGIDAWTFRSFGSRDQWPVWVDFTGGAGVDDVAVGAGRLRATGGPGDDRFFGAGGNDLVFGGAGDDVVHGGGGRDVLDGGHDDDDLYGGPGDDTLDGGVGHDLLDGDGGTDRCLRGEERVGCER